MKIIINNNLTEEANGILPGKNKELRSADATKMSGIFEKIQNENPGTYIQFYQSPKILHIYISEKLNTSLPFIYHSIDKNIYYTPIISSLDFFDKDLVASNIFLLKKMFRTLENFRFFVILKYHSQREDTIGMFDKNQMFKTLILNANPKKTKILKSLVKDETLVCLIDAEKRIIDIVYNVSKKTYTMDQIYPWFLKT